MFKDTEKKILDSLKNGDPNAIKSIFFKFHSSLCNIAFRIVGNDDDAKDLVQDVFLKLWINRNNLSIRFSLSAYLKRAVINTSLNYIEKHKKVKKITLEKADLEGVIQNDTELEDNELSLKITSAIDGLPNRTRVVFLLIRFEELSYKEVAESLGISTKAVEKEMMRALRMLRLALKRYFISIVLTFVQIHILY